MELNSKGKLARFYIWFSPEGETLPQDFCSFFWGLVGRAFFIFVVGGGILAAVIIGLVYAALWLWAHKVGSLLAIGAFALTGLVVWLTEREKKIKIEFLSEVSQVIRGKVDAVKNRYCPRIDWKDVNASERDAETQ